MNIQVERLPECKVELNIRVPKDTVDTERSIIVGEFSTAAKVPGFRKGKVPMKVIEQRYASQIKDELHERLVRSGIREAVDQEKLNVLNVDEVTEHVLQGDGSFSFQAAVTVSPEFELPDYKAIPVRLPKMEIGDAQVEDSLGRLRERYATFSDVEGRALQMGDYAIVSYEGTIDGKPLAEVVEDAPPTVAKASAQWIRMDEEGFLPGFCEGIVGAEIDETREVAVKLDEDFAVTGLAGKEVLYKVEVSGIKEQELPELDDAFANKVEEGKTLDELKSVIREQLEEGMAEQLHNQKVNQVVAYLDEKSDFELPASVVAEEIQGRVDEIAADAQRRGMPEEEILAHQDEIVETASKQARVNVKTAFLLEKIAGEESIKVDDQELTGAIINMASRQGTPPKKFIKDLQKNQGIGRVRHSLLTQKALAFLVENAAVTEFDPEEEQGAGIGEG